MKIKRAKNEHKVIEFLNWVETMKTPLRISNCEVITNPKLYAQTMKIRILSVENQKTYNTAYAEIFRLKMNI